MPTDINTIISWFKTGKKPTQAQYEEAWRSFWNKQESIPASSVADLNAILDGKVDNYHLTDPGAHAELFANGSIVEVTRYYAQYMADTGALHPGKLYKITGCDLNLYDFYNDTLEQPAGITVFVFALTPNTFSREGWGEFFTPKYGRFGIFSLDTGYAQGQFRCWGGYVWQVLDAFAPIPQDIINDFELNGNRLKKMNTYSDIKNNDIYFTTYDVIKYDFLNDVIYYRQDAVGNVVEADTFYLRSLNYDEHSIRVFKWGAHGLSPYYNNYPYQYPYYGGKQSNYGGNSVRYSVFNNLNSMGFEWNNEIKNDAKVIKFHGNYIDSITTFFENKIDGGFILESIPPQETGFIEMKKGSQIIGINFRTMTYENSGYPTLFGHIINEMCILSSISWTYITTIQKGSVKYGAPLSVLLIRAKDDKRIIKLEFYAGFQYSGQTGFKYTDTTGEELVFSGSAIYSTTRTAL
jgi:hypothetical protein